MNTNFPHKILKGLPPYGPPALPFSSTGMGMHTEGLVVEFFTETEKSWVGNFQSRPDGHTYSGILLHPNQQDVVVIAAGSVYVINPIQKELVGAFSSFITDLSYSEVHNHIVFTDGIYVSILDATGCLRTSQRISWDGMNDVVFSDNKVTGNAYDAVNELWKPFEVNIPSLITVQGTFHPETFIRMIKTNK